MSSSSSVFSFVYFYPICLENAFRVCEYFILTWKPEEDFLSFLWVCLFEGPEVVSKVPQPTNRTHPTFRIEWMFVRSSFCLENDCGEFGRCVSFRVSHWHAESRGVYFRPTYYIPNTLWAFICFKSILGPFFGPKRSTEQRESGAWK